MPRAKAGQAMICVTPDFAQGLLQNAPGDGQAAAPKAPDLSKLQSHALTAVMRGQRPKVPRQQRADVTAFLALTVEEQRAVLEARLAGAIVSIFEAQKP